MLEEIIVSELDIIKQFDNGELDFNDFCNAGYLFKNKYMSVRGIAGLIGRSDTTVYQWLKKGSKGNGKNIPLVYKVVKELENKELLNLTYENKYFRFLNKLYAWAFYTGNIKDRIDIIYNNKKQKTKILNTIPEKLKLNIKCTDSAKRIRIKDGYLRKTIFGMGYPKKRKSKADLKLPSYLIGLMKTGDSEKKQAKIYLFDWVNILFSTKFKEERSKWGLYLQTCKNDKIANRLAKQHIKLLRYCMPKIEVRYAVYNSRGYIFFGNVSRKPLFEKYSSFFEDHNKRKLKDLLKKANPNKGCIPKL